MKQAQQLSPVPRKYLNQKNAAAYCGYGVESFKEYVRQYNIPRRGPDGRKYSVGDLDRFMANPLAFAYVKQEPIVRTVKQVTL